MQMNFYLIREGITATCVTLQVQPVGFLQRIMTAHLRMSGSDSQEYHFVAYGQSQDVSATDYLEESGTLYDVVNTRQVTGSHLELDLERI